MLPEIQLKNQGTLGLTFSDYALRLSDLLKRADCWLPRVGSYRAGPRPPLGRRVEGHSCSRPTKRRWAASTVLLLAVSVCGQPATKETIWLTVPEGATPEAVADSLVANHVIRSPKAFLRLARMERAGVDIKPGLYDFQHNMPIGRVLQSLRRGREPVKRFVLTRGSTLDEVVAALERAMGIDRQSLLAAATSEALLSRLGARGESAEGYVFPSVYHLRIGANAEEILDQMADTFEAHWRREWTGRSASLGLTRDEVVTLASIIEGEGAVGSDLSTISSVYHNRLNRGMRLQADPTVIYALGERRRLLNRDYRTESAFNTYLIEGLPPAPIGNPSAASIKAALYPDSTDFLYFVAQTDGRHRFSRTYEAHLRAIAQVRGVAGGSGHRD